MSMRENGPSGELVQSCGLLLASQTARLTIVGGHNRADATAMLLACKTAWRRGEIEIQHACEKRDDLRGR